MDPATLLRQPEKVHISGLYGQNVSSHSMFQDFCCSLDFDNVMEAD